MLYAHKLELTFFVFKTNSFKRNVTFIVIVTNDVDCAISSMRNLFFRFSTISNDFLFQVHECTSFIVVDVTNVLRISLRLLDYKDHYFDHFFRRDVATSTRLVDVLDVNIQFLDRWKSKAYLLYIDVDKEFILRASRQHQKDWDFFCLFGDCVAVDDVVLRLEKFFDIAISQLHRVLTVSEGIVVPIEPKHLMCFVFSIQGRCEKALARH